MMADITAELSSPTSLTCNNPFSSSSSAKGLEAEHKFGLPIKDRSVPMAFITMALEGRAGLTSAKIPHSWAVVLSMLARTSSPRSQ
jgi:hypothetical protein